MAELYLVVLVCSETNNNDSPKKPRAHLIFSGARLIIDRGHGKSSGIGLIRYVS